MVGRLIDRDTDGLKPCLDKSLQPNGIFVVIVALPNAMNVFGSGTESFAVNAELTWING